MYIARYFCQYFITSWGHIMGAKMETDMRKDIFDNLQKQSFSYYDEASTGKLMSRIVTDLFDISELAHHGPEDVFISILKIVGSFVIPRRYKFKNNTYTSSIYTSNVVFFIFL